MVVRVRSASRACESVEVGGVWALCVWCVYMCGVCACVWCVCMWVVCGWVWKYVQ